MPAVEVEGGGDHPFPAYLVNVNKDKIAKNTTKDLPLASILENRFIYTISTGEKEKKFIQTSIGTYEHLIRSDELLADLNPAKPRDAEVKANKEKLAAEQAKLAEWEKVAAIDITTDCETGWRLEIKSMKDGNVERKAMLNPDLLDTARKACAAAKISPGF